MIEEFLNSSEPLVLHDDMIFPVVPLRDIVVFPSMVVPVFVGREKSVSALVEADRNRSHVVLLTQKDALKDDPIPSDLFEYGTLASILQFLKLPDGTVKVLMEGFKRIRIKKFIDEKSFYEARIEILTEPVEDATEIEALARSLLYDFENYVKINRRIPVELVHSLAHTYDPSRLCDTIIANLDIKLTDKQEMFEMLSVKKRLQRALSFLEGETSIINMEKRIRSRVKRQMEKTQREYYLHEQIKAIQKELGEGSEQGDEIAEFEKRLQTVKLSKEAATKAQSELKKLRSASSMAPEAGVIRNYLEWLLSLPWGQKSRVSFDLANAQKILDEAHFGLKDVKERIIEYLAVQNRAKKVKGSIICLVGPPGVGKTSLAKSIAQATGRVYVKMALGGMRDEAEIRGHRRTYIGSMPGKIIQSMKKAKKSNPLFLLDEIDKMGRDFRGDPSSALLEVLDPEQNAAFVDHYLDVEYNLSDVMFITTANSLDIPMPLLDRMEIIRIAGYSEEEKLEIAKQHLLKKVLREHALTGKEFSLDEEAIRYIIQYYTREAGVRALERELMKLARKAVIKLTKEKVDAVAINRDNIEEYLGAKRYKYGQIHGEHQIGVTTGLAWTQVGGELLTIEGVVMPGKGKMLITGNLKDVMKESISAASSYVRSNAISFGIDPDLFDKRDIHVHVPEAATPKDGPSAGVAMVTSMVSVLTGIAVHKDVAMTGEITLSGRVLAIGGLKEKLLAAKRGGIKKVLIPEDNVKDLAEMPPSIKEDIEIIPVYSLTQVLEHALVTSLPILENQVANSMWAAPAKKDSSLAVN
ncbi:endopeptidase La [Bartonella sp. TP]|uniref:endopeptidase La n=1 Tax=Bartonella sp. TP TaxID=3057550 RepID=UPI0025B14A7A|nr:endopeptidase La [Bartonella sp. TP]MDN5248853.1 endopeptidase La [Alphaproteobacteria bacterium]WJW79850.1 endopeptidase La [Bartonella sp. TP]